MKLKLLTGLIVASLSMAAFADTSTSSSSTNSTTTATAKQKKQLNKLEAQLLQLQGEVNNIANSPKLAMMAQQTDRRVMSDSTNPFGLMPDTTFSSVLLQAKESLNAPLVMGGYLEADAQAWGGNLSFPTGGTTYHNGNSIYLTTAKLYTLANINDWTTAFLSLQGNTNNVISTTFDQAFLTFGDLKKYPLYIMIGKGYLPFGSFAGNAVWSNSITTNDFRTSQTNQVNLGFYQNGLTLNIAATDAGSTGTVYYGNNLSNFVYNANYAGNFRKVGYSIGASYMNDIRGTNNAIGNSYSATDFSGGSNGAYDFNGSLSYNVWSLNAEYASTIKSATNTNGSATGKISSWMTTVNYEPELWGQTTTFSLGYSASNNAANVIYPVSAMTNLSPFAPVGQSFKSQWIAFAQRPIYGNIYLGPEIDYAKTYANNNTWTGTLDLSAFF